MEWKKRSRTIAAPVRTGLVLLAALAFVSQPPAFGAPGESLQAGHNLETPPHWKSRYDRPAADVERRFVVMRPGWHFYAGPAAIFWEPGSFASGNFSVSSTAFLFPLGDGTSSSSTTHDSPFGIFFAGSELEGPAPAYISFQVRNGGQFRIAKHAGGTVETIVDWTDHDAVQVYGPDTRGTTENVLSINAIDDEVGFYVNDQLVHSLPRAGLPVDGSIGIRAGEGLSLHFTEITIGPNRREAGD